MPATQDIEVRAEVMKVPAYQFLWGICWPGGLHQAQRGAGGQIHVGGSQSGVGAGAGTTGPLLLKGTLVQKDLLKAETLMREAASLGFQRAQIVGGDAAAGMGSPLDYEEAYHWLHSTVIGDKALHQKATSLLSRLGNRMPANAIARARRCTELKK